MINVSSLFQQPLAFVDIETTGGNHFNSRVLEVGVVRVEQGRVVSRYQTLLHPDEPIPPFITALTGITDNDVAAAPRFCDMASELAEVLDGAIFVAHNVRFDYNFLKMEFERLGAPFRPPLLCTVRLSRRLFPEFRSHKLQALIERYGLQAPSRHRAYDDAHCLWQFLQVCLREFDLDTLEAAVKAQLGSQSVPSQLDREQVAALPDGPGVYIFEDADGAPLYVGKSVNVRRRVLSHFASDYGQGKELKLAAQVRRLRGLPTAGELSALLLESRLVKELQPLYNHRLRQRERVVVALRTETAAGYHTVELRETLGASAVETARLLATYTTMARAKLGLVALASEYRLCPKLLGLERTGRACFASQLGKCDRACEGAELASSYNARFAAAFERQRVVAWPFAGPVLIQERRPEVLPAGFVVDQWCLVAVLRELEDGTVEVETETNEFDLDQYKILRAYLDDPRRRRSVRVLTPEQARELVGAE